MVWSEFLDRLKAAGLNPVEEVYIDNYGNTLPLDHPEFRGRYFRCARGVIRCGGIRLEAFLFPSEVSLQDFVEVLGEDPWWIPRDNLLLHFPESDPAAVGLILEAVST
jgi:hypothetical protein